MRVQGECIACVELLACRRVALTRLLEEKGAVNIIVGAVDVRSRRVQQQVLQVLLVVWDQQDPLVVWDLLAPLVLLAPRVPLVRQVKMVNRVAKRRNQTTRELLVQIQAERPALVVLVVLVVLVLQVQSVA